MRIKRDTSIDCNAAMGASGRGDCLDARIFADGFLAVLYQQYRRAQRRSGRATAGPASWNPEESG
jgi:hypothetical protein